MTDLELLSAYLDDELSPRERALVETRLNHEADFKKLFGELKIIKTRVQALPTVKPPRAFTLKPEMIGLSSRRPFSFLPLLNFGTAVAAALFAVVLSVDLLRPPLARQEFSAPLGAAMPAPAQDQTIALTPTLPRTPETVSKSATSAPALAAGAAAAEAPKPAVRSVETLTATVIAQAPAIQNVAPTLTTTILPPTQTATAVVTVTPVPTVAPVEAASPLLWAEISLGGLLFVLIALSLIARTWK